MTAFGFWAGTWGPARLQRPVSQPGRYVPWNPNVTSSERVSQGCCQQSTISNISSRPVFPSLNICRGTLEDLRFFHPNFPSNECPLADAGRPSRRSVHPSLESILLLRHTCTSSRLRLKRIHLKLRCCKPFETRPMTPSESCQGRICNGNAETVPYSREHGLSISRNRDPSFRDIQLKPSLFSTSLYHILQPTFEWQIRNAYAFCLISNGRLGTGDLGLETS